MSTIIAIGVIATILGTVFAMSDNFIYKATFKEFKEHVIYRLDVIDQKLDLLLNEKQ